MFTQQEVNEAQRGKNGNTMAGAGTRQVMAQDFNDWLEDSSDVRTYSCFHPNVSIIVFDGGGWHEKWSSNRGFADFSDFDPDMLPPELDLAECIPNIWCGEDNEEMWPAVELFFTDGSVWVNGDEAGSFAAGWHAPECDRFNVNRLEGKTGLCCMSQYESVKNPKRFQRYWVRSQPPFLIYDRVGGGAYAVGDQEDMEEWCAELNRRPTQRASEKDYRAWRAKTDRGQARRSAKKPGAKKRSQ